jgi:phage tail-like protein
MNQPLPSGAKLEVDVDPAISLYFKVEIQGKDIGCFMSCEGLSLEVTTDDVTEGGNNGFLWILPKRIKYTNVKLSRPIGPDSKLLAEWIAGMTGAFERRQATITALNAKAEPLVSWVLQGVIPVRWQGPSFNAESGKVATETLELAHHGFTYEDRSQWG